MYVEACIMCFSPTTGYFSKRLLALKNICHIFFYFWLWVNIDVSVQKPIAKNWLLYNNEMWHNRREILVGSYYHTWDTMSLQTFCWDMRDYFWETISLHLRFDVFALMQRYIFYSSCKRSFQRFFSLYMYVHFCNNMKQETVFSPLKYRHCARNKVFFGSFQIMFCLFAKLFLRFRGIHCENKTRNHLKVGQKILFGGSTFSNWRIFITLLILTSSNNLGSQSTTFMALPTAESCFYSIKGHT